VLANEIALLRGLSGRKLTHLHWGGGTPSILGGDGLGLIVDRLSGLFDLGAIKEHAIELDPRRTDRELVRALAGLAVNRASLGVQEFTPTVQQAIRRVQSFELVKRVTGDLRDAGIEAINFDLMYGLPNQTVANAAQTASLAASLKPNRIALFGYAHVPWFKKHQRVINVEALPGLTERLEQAAAAAEALKRSGYVALGLDHFALPDDELRPRPRTGHCAAISKVIQSTEPMR
jgi:oxygen-independent coproporphyrinogen-3 oxidase